MQRYFSLSKKVIEISNDDIYHILKVMRGKVGDRFEVVKDNDVIVCEITSTSPFEIREIETLSSKSELNKDITLFYCLAKGDKNDLVIQKCTELGVKNIVFLSSKRSIIKLSQDDFNKKKVRFEKIAKEASEQSKRTRVPSIYGLYDINHIPNELLTSLNLVAYELENGKTNKTSEFFHEFKSNLDSVSVLIGPEGGLEKEEIISLEKQGFKTISLGKRILRTETAAIYALSVLSFILENENE